MNVTIQTTKMPSGGSIRLCPQHISLFLVLILVFLVLDCLVLPVRPFLLVLVLQICGYRGDGFCWWLQMYRKIKTIGNQIYLPKSQNKLNEWAGKGECNSTPHNIRWWNSNNLDNQWKRFTHYSTRCSTKFIMISGDLKRNMSQRQQT